MVNTMYLLLFIIPLVYAKNEEYIGYKVYDIKITNEEQQDNLHKLKSDGIDFWKVPSIKHKTKGRVMVPPSHFNWFENNLEEMNIEKDISVEDVYEFLSGNDVLLTTNDNTTFSFDGYYRYDDIVDYMKSIEDQYSNSTTVTVNIVDYGTTEENRHIYYMKISSNSNSNNNSKPIVIIEAGINPREWITVPAALNIVKETLKEDNRRLLDEFDWIVIPVLNPDGYEYTHTNLRLWQKSRSTKSHMGLICPGVNINRNFDLDWLHFESSSSPCSHLYGGTNPFSEIETKLVKSLLEEYGLRIRLYVSLQNNGGYITYPWLYERAANGMFRHHHLLGLKMIEAMNNTYVLDIGSVAFDRISGTSTDYIRDNGVLYSFIIDIVQSNGFDIPADEISGVADDVWRAIRVAAGGVL